MKSYLTYYLEIGRKMILTKDFQQSSLSILAMLSTGMSILIIYKLIINNTGLESIGLLSLALSLSVLMRMLDITGASYCARFIAEVDSETEDIVNRKARIIDTATWVAVIFYSVLGFISINISPILLNNFYEEELAEQLVSLVPFVLLLLCINGVMETQNGSLDGLHLTIIRSIINIVGSVLCIALAVWLIPIFGVLGAVISQCFQACFSILLCRIVLAMNINDLRIYPRYFSSVSFRALLRFGSTMHVNTLSGFAFDPAIKILIAQFGGSILLAYYDLSLKTVALVRSAFGAAFIPIYNNFASFKSGNIKANYIYFDKIVSLNSFLVGVCFSVAAFLTPVISIIFLDEIDITFINIAFGILVAYALNALSLPLMMYAQSCKRLFWNNASVLTIASLALSMSALLGLYKPMLAAYGFPFGMILGTCVGYIGNRKEFIKEYNELEELNLNEARNIRSILAVIITVVTILGFNLYLM